MHRSDPDARRKWLATQQPQAEHWTSILRRAGAIARTIRSERPCNYGPWQTALRQSGVDWMDLATFASNVCGPPWPDDCADLSEFALTFLEEDPMLFRSGYTKRHFAKRLGQQPMKPSQIARLHTVLRRAVLEGAGLEEFRAYCKLAARLQPDGLQDWLAEQATDVRLSLSHDIDGASISTVRAQFSAADMALAYGLAVWPRKPAYALGHDLQPPLYPMTHADWANPANKSRVNAWRMLRAMRRRNNQGKTVQTITAHMLAEGP
jgi:hypothetical protein